MKGVSSQVLLESELTGTSLTLKRFTGVYSNNHILELAILRPGDSQRQPLPIPPSEAVDVRAAHPTVFPLQHDEPGLQLTTPVPAPATLNCINECTFRRYLRHVLEV